MLLSYSVSGICQLSLPFVTKELQDNSLMLLQMNLHSLPYSIKQ